MNNNNSKRMSKHPNLTEKNLDLVFISMEMSNKTFK